MSKGQDRRSINRYLRFPINRGFLRDSQPRHLIVDMTPEPAELNNDTYEH